jgi:glycosyltransferase involved in cell wall biosynthesis
MGKIWFDISGIYSWQGNFTGIQRIVYNLAKELNGSDKEAGFFVYNGRGFSPVSFETLELRLKELNVALSHGEKSVEKLSLAKVRHNTILGLKSTVLGTRAEPVLRSVYSSARNVYKNTRALRAKRQPGIFKSDDTVIVVDGNWQFRGYADILEATKSDQNFKLVHFIHDLAAINNPALASPGAKTIITNYLSIILEISDTLITISNSTKRDTEEYIKRLRITNMPKISTLVMGDNMSTEAIKATKPDISVPEDYILAVSTIEVRKNYLSLYYAYKLAIQRGLELPHLIIVGKKGWMAEEVYSLLTKDPEIKPHVSILHGISDQELEWLYRNCRFTVFPSFYEGWGLPIIESFAYGKACICSNTSSMPEAGGNLATYISPYNTEELLSAIVQLYGEPVLRSEIERRIKSEYKKQTWQKVFKELQQILVNE